VDIKYFGLCLFVSALTRAQRTRAHFNPQHCLLCHLDLPFVLARVQVRVGFKKAAGMATNLMQCLSSELHENRINLDLSTVSFMSLREIRLQEAVFEQPKSNFEPRITREVTRLHRSEVHGHITKIGRLCAL